MRFKRFLDQLELDEGFQSTPYQDTVGVWTIGFGNTKILGESVSRRTSPIGISMAREMLRSDAFLAGMDADEVFNNFNSLDDVRQEVVANMAFNLGITRLRGFSKMIAAVERSDFNRAGDEMQDSRWFNQVGRRAKRLVAQMISGDY